MLSKIVLLGKTELNRQVIIVKLKCTDHKCKKQSKSVAMLLPNKYVNKIIICFNYQLNTRYMFLH